MLHTNSMTTMLGFTPKFCWAARAISFTALRRPPVGGSPRRPLVLYLRGEFGGRVHFRIAQIGLLKRGIGQRHPQFVESVAEQRRQVNLVLIHVV